MSSTNLFVSEQSLVPDFKELIEDNLGIISKICRIYADDREEFNDYFQEVTFQLWKSYQNFKGNSALSTWVYRVTLNVCLLQVKKKKRNRIVLTDQLPTSWYEESSDEKEETIRQLYASIRKLKKDDRAVILLFLEDKSYQEIAEILGITVSNVGVKLNRIKQRLKEMMHERA